MERSFDAGLMRTAMGDFKEDVDCEAWVANDKNVMLVKGEDVGLATYEYPGVYNVHWFFKVRGRKAIELAKEMLDEMFSNYGLQTMRGITRVDIRGARWAARQVGCTSHGIIEYPDGYSYELFLLTKDEFYREGR
jgi:hypothetical protein